MFKKFFKCMMFHLRIKDKKRIMLTWCLSNKESACNAGDTGSIPGLGRSAREGNSYPLQIFCLGNPTDRGAWWAIVHGVAKSWT